MTLSQEFYKIYATQTIPMLYYRIIINMNTKLVIYSLQFNPKYVNSSCTFNFFTFVIYILKRMCSPNTEICTYKECKQEI